MLYPTLQVPLMLLTQLVEISLNLPSLNPPRARPQIVLKGIKASPFSSRSSASHKGCCGMPPLASTQVVLTKLCVFVYGSAALQSKNAQPRRERNQNMMLPSTLGCFLLAIEIT